MDPPGHHYRARIDSGAETSSLSASEVIEFERDGDDWVRFTFQHDSADDAIDFYGDGAFTHGCSVDHIIFDFLEMTAEKERDYWTSDDEKAKENRRRFEITIENAREFIAKSTMV